MQSEIFALFYISSLLEEILEFVHYLRYFWVSNKGSMFIFCILIVNFDLLLTTADVSQLSSTPCHSPL